MEITVAYFWLIKLVFEAVAFGTLWLSYKHRKSRKLKMFWLTISIISFAIGQYLPIHMELPNRAQYNMEQTHIQSTHNNTPPMIVDDSFNHQLDSKGITKKEIDLKGE